MSTYVGKPRLEPPVREQDHIRGPRKASVTLVEYGDFQCPYCGEAYPIVKQIEETLGDELRVVFRHFPITTKHQFAAQAAEAAEAAGAQGQFWEMHDLLYENQNNLHYEGLFVNAEYLGLDLDQFGRDLAEHTFLGHIQDDLRSGIRSGVSGTPTFFVNGGLYEGEDEFDPLLEALRSVKARR